MKNKHIKIAVRMFKCLKISVYNYFVLVILLAIAACANTAVSYFCQIGINAATASNVETLYYLFPIMIIFIIIYGISIYVQMIYKEKLKQKISIELKSNVLSGLIYNYYLSNKNYTVGEFIVKVMDDSDLCSDYIIYTFFPAVQLLLTMLFGFAYIFSVSWEIGTIALFIVPLFYAINKSNVDKISLYYRLVKKEDDKIMSLSKEVFLNLPVVKVFNMSEKIKKKYNQLIENKYVSEINSQIYIVKLKSQTEVQLYLMEIICVVIGVILFRIDRISLGALVGMVNVLLGSIVYSVIDFPDIISALAKQFGALERISDLIDLQIKQSIEGTSKNINSSISLEVENLKFSYGDIEILKNVNMKVNRGETILLLGNSGQGKTTLIKNILGLLNPLEGEIQIRVGHELYRGDRKEFISYLPQENTLIGISLKDNITLGNFIDEDSIKLVLKSLDLWGLIEKCPKGIDGIIGKDISPSYGEIQRLNLARVIIENKPIIILDEPFSAIDTNNIDLIIEYINASKVNKIIIIVTHQLNNINFEHKVYYLHKGELIDG